MTDSPMSERLDKWSWCPVLQRPVQEGRSYGHGSVASDILCGNTPHLELFVGGTQRKSPISCCETNRPPYSGWRQEYETYTCSDCGCTWEWVEDEAAGAAWWPVNA